MRTHTPLYGTRTLRKTNSRWHRTIYTINTSTPTRVPNTKLQQTSSADVTMVSNALYNRTLWTTQHALSSNHLPIITTINILHDYGLLNQPTFTNYKNANTIYRRHTESAFAQTNTLPTNRHTANRKTIYQRVRCTTTAGCYPTTTYEKSQKEITWREQTHEIQV